MKVIKLSQQNDRETWLQFRRGKISGTKAREVRPLTRGADRTPQGFWKLLAEKISVEPDGENVMDRGLRLENEALAKTALQFNLTLDLDPGMWVSDEDEDIAVSPDAAEECDRPTFAAETKSLSSDNHLKYIIYDLRAKKRAALDQEDPDYQAYQAIDQVPPDYREQVVQYFVVNEYLRALYFTLYDDRIALDGYDHHVIVVERKDIEQEIEMQKSLQLQTLREINQLIAELAKE